MQPEFHLTPEEAVLVGNSDWLIAKQRIVGKVYGIFGMLSEKYSEILQDYTDFIPKEVLAVSPKIYKGEMYRQMPYVMLDHPRYFDKADVFAIRSFFWWGNHFSIHLVLAGKYRERYEDALLPNINAGAFDQWYLGVSEDPWEHHFDEDNYQQVHQLRSRNAVHTSLPYFKLANWHSLDDWQDAYQFYIHSYTKLLECIAS